jgi:hypothetical protein
MMWIIGLVLLIIGVILRAVIAESIAQTIGYILIIIGLVVLIVGIVLLVL